MNATIETPAYTRANAPAVHEWYGPTGVHFRDIRSPGGFYHHDTTSPEIVRLIDRYHGGARVRVFYGDTETGRDWMEENDVTGYIGATTGWKKSAILVSNSRSMGGAPILSDCIVRMQVNGVDVYRHPKYVCPYFHIEKGAMPDLPWEVSANGSVHARFATFEKADRWCKFMRGERAGK